VQIGLPTPQTAARCTPNYRMAQERCQEHLSSSMIGWLGLLAGSLGRPSSASLRDALKCLQIGLVGPRRHELRSVRGSLHLAGDALRHRSSQSLTVSIIT
jgi:hypothetical protein